MKRRLIITTLVVTSLPITLSASDDQKAKGGTKFTHSNSVSISSDRFWTVTETRANGQVDINRVKRTKSQKR